MFSFGYDKRELFVNILPRNHDLDYVDVYFTVFYFKTNLKLNNSPLSPKLLKKVIRTWASKIRLSRGVASIFWKGGIQFLQILVIMIGWQNKFSVLNWLNVSNFALLKPLFHPYLAILKPLFHPHNTKSLQWNH